MTNYLKKKKKSREFYSLPWKIYVKYAAADQGDWFIVFASNHCNDLHNSPLSFTGTQSTTRQRQVKLSREERYLREFIFQPSASQVCKDEEL